MVRVNDTNFKAEYLENPEDFKVGMSGRETLDGCMVFKMGKGHHTFWMKDTLIPLDIVFVLGKKISFIHHDCEPCNGECEKKYSGIGDHVIEFPAGTAKNWKVGDVVNMYLGSPENPVN